MGVMEGEEGGCDHWKRVGIWESASEPATFPVGLQMGRSTSSALAMEEAVRNTL